MRTAYRSGTRGSGHAVDLLSALFRTGDARRADFHSPDLYQSYISYALGGVNWAVGSASTAKVSTDPYARVTHTPCCRPERGRFNM